MKILSLIATLSLLTQTAFADVYPEMPNQGDKYVKITKNKSGLISFQKCEIPASQITNVCDFRALSCQVADREVENCTEVVQSKTRTYYSPSILKSMAQSYRAASTAGATISFLFLLGAGITKNAEMYMASKTINDRVVSGKKVLLIDSSNSRTEIEKNGEYINQNMDMYLQGLSKMLEKYNKAYPNKLAGE